MRPAPKNAGEYVVIISSEDDVHSLVVAKKIEEVGKTPIILDAAEYPVKWQVSADLRECGESTWTIRNEEIAIRSNELLGVWVRRRYPHAVNENIIDQRYRDFAFEESRDMFRGWLLSINKRVINPIHCEYAANHKAYQLCCAQRAGLRIPDTQLTSEFEQFEEFYHDQEGEIIHKAFTAPNWHLVETKKVTKGTFDNKERISLAPVIFQRTIPRGTDIRATVVDREIFAASIHTEDVAANIDWRVDISPVIKEFVLPSNIQSKILKLMEILGIRYGAADLRMDKNGDFYFFEVNPGGQFLFVEIQTKQAISRAIAHALVGKA